MKRAHCPAFLTVILTLTLFASYATAQTLCPDFSEEQSGSTPDEETPGVLHVSGRIATVDGVPVADAVVTVHCSLTKGEHPSLTVASDAEGEYRLELPVRRSFYRIRVTHPGFVELEDSLGVGAAGEFERDYRLHPTVAVLKGVVRNDQGQPVDGARVTLALSNFGNGRVHTAVAVASLTRMIDTRTAPDGSYSLPDLPAGRASIQASGAPGDHAASETIELHPGEQRHDLVLSRGATFSFKVLDTSGRRMSGVQLFVAPFGGSTRWGEDGRVALTVMSLPAGPFRCLVTAPGFSAKEIILNPEVRSTPDVLLDPGTTTMKGVLVDEAGKPVPNQEVQLQSYWYTVMSGPQGEHPRVVGFGGEHVTTNEEGAFELQLSGPPSEFLEHELQLKGRGYVTCIKVLTEEEVRDGVRITLQKTAGSISGQVLAADGAPLESYQVTVLRSDRSEAMGQLAASPPGDLRRNRAKTVGRFVGHGSFSNRDGRFTIEDLPEGELEVAVSSMVSEKRGGASTRVTVIRGVPTAPLMLRLSAGSGQ